MYKKRFAKWGFQKYAKSSPAAVQMSRTETQCKKLRPPERRRSFSMPALLTLGSHDGLKLEFLMSVQTLGISFFESVQSVGGFLASIKDRKHPLDQPRVSLTFKVVIDRLNRGHGNLAGRMARKAFLLLEDLLMLGAPALMWNLLEMMHYMVALGHTQLFQTLLAHLVALADARLPHAHPLSAVLRNLRGLVVGMLGTASYPSSPSSSIMSASPSSLSTTDGTPTNVDHCLLVRTLPSLLEQGWILNAKILFDHFEPKLMELYCQLWCDSCSIELPGAIVDAAVPLLSQIETRQKPSLVVEASLVDEHVVSGPLAEQKMLQRLLAPRRDASPPQDYDMVRASSTAALWEHGSLIVKNAVGLPSGTKTDIVAALLTARILEGRPVVAERLSRAESEKVQVPRIYAGNVACTIKALMENHVRNGKCKSLEGFSDNVERFRTLVALREYANGEQDLLVIWEMWLLEDELVAAGEWAEAQKVGRDAYRRLETYLQEIPLGSA